MASDDTRSGSSAPVSDTLEDLNRRLHTAREAGDRGTEALIRARKAAVYLEQGRAELAADEFGQAARLAAADDKPRIQAQLRFAQGLALQFLPDAGRQAHKAFQAAAEAAGQAGDQALELKAREKLVALHTRAGDVKAAVAETTAALQHIDPERDPQAAAQWYQSLAGLHWIEGQEAAALDDLLRAYETAQRAGHTDQALQLQVMRQSLENALTPEQASPAQFTDFLRQAQQLGQMPLIGDIQLQQATSALSAGEFAEAIESAEAARQAALQDTEPARYVRYLLACLTIALARESLGDRPGVLAILLTCKATLEQYVGRAIGQQIVQVLEALEARWGSEGMAEARRLYRQRMSGAAPVS